MKKRLIALMLVFAMLCAAPAALAKTYLTMAAVASSSGLFPYVVSIGKVLNTYCPDYSITVSESGGNVDNTKRLRNGEVKIANSISNTDYESYSGTGTTFNGNPFTDFRILWYYEKSPIQICVALDTGIESIYDATLSRINRGHTHAQTADAVTRSAACGIRTGAHLILGLPGESREAILAEAGILSALPLTTLKLHQLQLIKGTRMAQEFAEQPSDFHLFTPDEYIDLVIDFIERLRPDLILERFVSQSPSSLLALPGWGLKNHEFVDRLRARMQTRNAHQGRLCLSSA
jgi:hypothetical protein